MSSPDQSGVHRVVDYPPLEVVRPTGVEARAERLETSPPVPIPVPAPAAPPPTAGVDDLRRTPAAPGLADRPAPTDPASPELLLNRELTYLNFCSRVLREAEDERNPLLERLKFVSIVASNVDEFFQKRIGGLKQQVGAGLHSMSPDGRSPLQQISDSIAAIHALEARKAKILERTLVELKTHGVWLASYKELDPAQQVQVRDYYVKN